MEDGWIYSSVEGGWVDILKCGGWMGEYTEVWMEDR
jgi:hypothetical protein